MIVKEYLGQAYLLDQRIKSDMMEIEELRSMAESVSSPGFEEHYNASKNTDALYIHTLELLWEIEEKWKRIRDRYAAAHPFCEQCLADGKYVKTEEIHHKLPLSQGETYDGGNLIALCKECYARIRAERGDRWHNKSHLRRDG